MLIPLGEILERHGHRLPSITGVLHLGGHEGEEADAYAQSLGDVGSGPSANVWWVEGNPSLMGKLVNHVQPFGHRCINALVGAKDGLPVTFNIADNGQSSSVLALGTHEQVSPDVHYIGTQEHELRTVDALVEAYGIAGINLVNADLQGYELEALRGAEKLLAGVDVLYLECNLDHLYEDCCLVEDLDLFLGDRGFERVETRMAGDQERGGANWTGWGDCVYLKVRR